MSGKAAAPLSACVITYNEQERIAACLQSLRWCDDIVVVDSRSTDATGEIAHRLGARVIEADWRGYAAQKDFAVAQAQYDWVLCVDADEVVSPALSGEIGALRQAGFPGASGWQIARRTWYLGNWIRHGTWYPDWSLRLFDRRRGGWQPHPLYDVHERVVLEGSCARLRGELLHFPYEDLSAHLRTIDRYTTLMATGLHAHGRRATAARLVGDPAWEYFRSLILKRGFLDGWRGWLVAALHAHYVRMKYAKLKALDVSHAESTLITGRPTSEEAP